MFVPCPHCGFLVALIVSRDAPSQRCPRCGNELHSEEPHRDDDAEQTSLAAVVPRASDAGAEAAAAAGAVTSAAAPLPATADEPTNTEAMSAAQQAASRVGDGAANPANTAAGDNGGDGASNAEAAPAARTVSAPPPRRREGRTPAGTRRAPSFARRHAPAVGGGVRWRGWLMAAALLAVLAVQLLLAQRDDLAASPRWRPLASGVCAALGCELPPWREPRAFTMLSRSVQPAPGRPHVLTVEASFRNDARWPQPWPVLWLGLSDVDARISAQRAFTAREYLGPDADAARELAPGQSANVRFEIAEPATRTVAFTFEFH